MRGRALTFLYVEQACSPANEIHSVQVDVPTRMMQNIGYAERSVVAIPHLLRRREASGAIFPAEAAQAARSRHDLDLPVLIG